MLTVKSMLQAYLYSIIQASKALYKNWLIVPGSIVAYSVYIIISNLMSPLGIAGGFVVGMVSILLLSIYYRWINSAVNKDTLTIKDLVSFDYALFSSAMSVAFVLYLLLYFSQLLAPPDLLPFITLGLFIAFNCIPEVIYSEQYESIAAFRKSLDFIQAHPLEWFLPFFILFLPLVIGHGAETLILLMTDAQPLLPSLLMITQIQMLIHQPVVGPIVGVFFGTWFMLFRGVLYNKLDRGGSRWLR